MFWLGKSVKVPSNGLDKKKMEKVSLSPLEVLILSQLRSRELRNKGIEVGQYGYEMIQQLNELFAGTWEAKSGTIYPILSKLEGKKKLIMGKREKSPLGPVKKVYVLEPKGRMSIDAIIQSNFKGDLEFISQYIDLLTPFLTTHENQTLSDDIFDELIVMPKKSVEIAIEKAITEVDEDLCRQKLEALATSLKQSLHEIDKKLAEFS